MDVQDWATISRLLDEALGLPVADRETWLARLPARHAALKPRLQSMLAEAADGDGEAFLAALPRLDVGALVAADGLRLHAGEAGTLVGPYRLVRELASGGQGTVWLAEREDGLVRRPVALKLPIGLAFRPHLADRMARERDILARLAHPHIARLYDAGFAADGTPYLALEYVEGLPIDQHCDRHRLGVRARVQLFLQVVRAVAYAHGRLALHRDLKPSNIMVTGAGDVRLLDFGIARLLAGDGPGLSTLTSEGGVAMTLHYASPEQIRGGTLDVASDVYSLGVVLYELLAGARPYRPARDTVAALEEAILGDDPVAPSAAASRPERRRALSGDLDTIVLKALRKAPEARYPDAAALADDLERYLEGLPVHARPDRAWYRAAKFIRRHQLAVAAAAVAMVAVLAGSAAAIWQARVARAEQARAEAVTSFIRSIFREADPSLRGADRPVTAGDLLRMARTRADRELADQPDTRAELLRILGDGLASIGEPAGAAEVLRASLDETRRLHGPDSPEAIETLLLLAEAEQYDARSARAADAIDEAAAALARRGGAEAEPHVRVQLLRAQVLLNRGRAATPEAEEAATAARDLAARVLPRGHAMHAVAADLLSTVYRTRGRAAEALEHAENAYRASLAAFEGRADHPRVIVAQNVYGRALYEADRPEEALRHLKEAARLGVEVYRENGLLVQHLLGTLANVQLAIGEIRDAVANLEQALAVDLGGARVSDTYLGGQSMVQARAYVAARRPADALSHFEAATTRLGGAENAAVARTLAVEHAAALQMLGQPGRARARLGDLNPAAGPRAGATDLRLALLRARLAADQRRSDEAREQLERAAALQPGNPGARLAWAEVQLALALLRLEGQEFDRAGAALDAADATVRAIQRMPTPLSADIATARGRLALARGDRAAAAVALDEADRFWQDFAPGHPDAERVARLLRQARR